MGHTGFQPMKCDGRSVFDEKVNVILTALNIAVHWRSGSLAVPAEMVHNVVDLAASVAVLVGLKLSRRQSTSFPYGLHKVENVVAAGVAMLILLAAYEITREALLGTAAVPRVTPWVLAGVETPVHRADSVEAALAAQP